jgi:hypothetical protein
MNNTPAHLNILPSRRLSLPLALGIMVVAFLSYFAIVQLDMAKIAAIIGILVILVVSAMKISNFIYILLALKPFIDLTWNSRFLSVGRISLGALHFIGFYVFVVAGLFYFFNRGKIRIYNEGVIWLFMILNIFSSMAAILGSHYPIMNVMDSLLRIFDAYFMYFIFHRFFENDESLLKISATVWLSTLLVGIVSIVVYSTGRYNVDMSQQVVRFAGLYNDPGSPSYIAIMSLVFGALYFEKYKGKKRSLVVLAYASTYIVAGIMLKLTITKSAIIMLVIFLIMWLGVYKKKLVIIAPAVIIFGYLFYAGSEAVQMRMKNEVEFFQDGTFSAESARSLGTGRVAQWERVLSFYSNNYNAFQKVFGSARDFGAHNQYIAYLMTVGILGLAVFLFILWRFYKRLFELFKKFRQPEIYMSIVALTIFVVYGITGHPFEYTTLLWYLMLLLSLLNVRQRDVGSPISSLSRQ